MSTNKTSSDHNITGLIQFIGENANERFEKLSPEFTAQPEKCCVKHVKQLKCDTWVCSVKGSAAVRRPKTQQRHRFSLE